MYLVEPTGRKKKWDIRLRLHDGRTVRIPGDRDESIARKIGDRLEVLVRAKAHAELPPVELVQWIENMPVGLAKRLVELELLPQRRFDRHKTVSESIDDFAETVSLRKSNKEKHWKLQSGRVRKVCNALKIQNLNDLTEKALLKFLVSQGFATSTRRAYIIVMNDFAKEMLRTPALTKNPFENTDAPGQYEDPVYERQPLTVTQFKKLMAHLDTFTRYETQRARWTANDRKIIYWTAVKTAYRQSELRKLQKSNFFLAETPPVVVLKARDAKNKRVGEVPIPRDLAEALKVYLAPLDDADLAFPIPATSGSCVDMMRRDLDGAGIVWKLSTGEVIDFHTLRSTAITWWLDEDGLNPKRVQILSRLSTLALVAKYSRNLRLDGFEWLENGPILVLPAVAV